jgi:hypothetical protein
MIRRDWFEERIEILAQALAAALGLKAKGDVQAAIENSEAAFSKAFGMKAGLALGLPLEQFLGFACRGEKPTPEFLAALAKMFSEWAAILKAGGREAEAAMAQQRSQECLVLQTTPLGNNDSA